MNGKFKCLVTLLISFLSTGLLCAKEAPPRLWEISGENEQGVTGKFYLLPVTHNGLDVEYDDYFEDTVVPMALSADIFSFENAPLSSTEIPSCRTPLADTAENRSILHHARNDVERVAYETRTPIPRAEWMSEQDWKEVQEIERIIARDSVLKLSELGLIVRMDTLLIDKQIHFPETFAKVDYVPRPDVANYLAHHRLKIGKTRNESIDLVEDITNFYCAIPPLKRGRFLQKKIAEADPLFFRPLSKHALVLAGNAFATSMRLNYLVEGFSSEADDDFRRHAVCDRNEKWLREMNRGLGEGVKFYALGVAHVLQPGLADSGRCDGLLARLRQQGYAIRLVNRSTR